MTGPEHWNRRYLDGTGSAQPAQVLLENRHLLPRQGRALDLACGTGANSLLLAEHGLQVSAWDFSEVAIGRLRATAAQMGLSVTAEVRDVSARPPAARSFEVIVVSRFLDRALVPYLIAALPAGGLIFYQTFVRDALDSSIGPRDVQFRLERNELLELFSPLYLLFYREDDRKGDPALGMRNEAMLVAEQP